MSESDNHFPRNPKPPEPVAVIGPPVDTSRDMPEVEKGTRPRYPDEAWKGTPYYDFAEASSRGNYIPKKFFIESMRTVVGAIVGGQLRCPIEGVNPRAFTVRVAPAGSGKGTSDSYVRNFFDVEWDGLVRSGESRLLWSSPGEHVWKSRGIGAWNVIPASAPGLMKALQPRKLKKGETANPLETWRPIPRVITLAEEVRSLFANFQNESTGAGLESVLCELYDRNSFTSTATKDRSPESGDLMYSLCGGITPEGWASAFGKVSSTESGFLSRINIVGTEEKRTVADLERPDFTSIRRRFLPMIYALEQTPIELRPSESSRKRMSEWFHAFQMPEGIGKARLNIHGWRTALHLAWLKGHAHIELDDTEGGIACAEYLAAMRVWYAPAEGETRHARTEAGIRKVIQQRGRCTVRELKAATHAKKVSAGDWDKALKALCAAGEVRVEVAETGKKTVILLKEMD